MGAVLPAYIGLFSRSTCTRDEAVIGQSDPSGHFSACRRDGEADRLRELALEPATWLR